MVSTVKIGTLAIENPIQETRTELDSHADTCVVGNDTALLIFDYERPVRVFGYNEDVGEKAHCKTVSAVVAYDHPTSGRTYMLIINQAILIPSMKVNLLSSMQLRDNDIRVNDEPKCMVPNPTEYHHALLLPPTEEDEEELLIPLSIHKVTSYFATRKPTLQEFEATESCYCRALTADAPEWDTETLRFQEQEESMTNLCG